MGLDAVELVMGVEEEFGISIKDEDAAQFRTVGEMFEHVLALIQQKPREPEERATVSGRKAFRMDQPKPEPKTREAAWRRYVNVIVDQLGVDESQVAPEARFIDDLGVD